MTIRFLIAPFALVGLLASPSAAAPPDPSLLRKVSMYEGSVSFITPASLGSDRYVDAALAKVDHCITAVDAAISSGHKASSEAKVDDAKRYTSGRTDKQPGRTAVNYAPLGEIRAMCADMRAKVGVVQVKSAVDEAHQQAAGLMRPGKTLGKTDAVVARLYRDKCIAAVDKAIKRKVAASATLETRYGAMTLGQTKDKGCAPIGALIAKAQAAGQAAVDAKYAPWKKALKGDKLKTFIGKKMLHFRVFTKGGKLLSQPAQFAKAKVWFETLRSGHFNRWRLKRFAFRGNRLVSTKIIEGKGRKAPSKAYR